MKRAGPQVKGLNKSSTRTKDQVANGPRPTNFIIPEPIANAAGFVI